MNSTHALARTARIAAGSAALCLLLLGAAVTEADAAIIAVTTTGVVSGPTFSPANSTGAGLDAGNLFGLGTNLDGDSYTLTVIYSPTGSNYVSTGTSAFDIGETTAPATVAVTINGVTLTKVLTNGISSSLSESSDPTFGITSLTGNLLGNAADGSFSDASQSILSSANFIGDPDLLQSFSYTLGVGDSGTDDVSITDGNGGAILDFEGTTQTVSVSVPEPASLGLLAIPLMGLTFLRRRGSV